MGTSHNSGAGHHPGHAQTSKRASISCVVGSTSVTCPDPTCTMTDHHDGTGECDNPKVVLVRGGNTRNHRPDNLDIDANLEDESTPGHDMTAAQARASYTAALTASTASSCTVSTSTTSPSTCVNREELGQYLVTYTASDASGNKAEPVAFSFLFIDPFVPVLNFGGSNSHNDLGRSSRMFGYPNTESGYPSFTTRGQAIFPGTDGSYGCGSVCDADDLQPDDNGNGKTWGALYSAVGSESTNKDFVDDLWTTDFTSTPTADVDGDGYLRTLTADSNPLTADVPTEIDTAEITKLNLASTYGTHSVVTEASQNFEAGWIKGHRYGGFFDEQEKKEQNPDKDAGFCAYDLDDDNTAAENACAGKTESACTTTNSGCSWHAPATRDAQSAKWSYSVVASATDNYRCQGITGACTALKVYYQLIEGSTVSEWSLASGNRDIVMSPGKKVRISWFVDDSAGDFGFKQMSNPQTHTIQFYVTDKTRPIITPAQKATYVATSATTDFQTSTSGFAVDPTVLTDAALTTLGYASVKCTQINDQNLCTGTCSWSATNGCTGAAADTVLQSCVSKVTDATDDNSACYSKGTAALCWDEKDYCFWTTSQTFVDNGDYDGSTCDGGLTEYSYYVPDCSATTKDTDKRHNAKCNAGSMKWENNQMKYNEYKKCRPESNVVDRTSFSVSKNAYTMVVECGYKADQTAYGTAANIDTDSTVKSGYREFGARAFDNWDNVDDAGSTSYKNIDLFTDGTQTNCVAATGGVEQGDGAWVSCERSAGTPATPSDTSFVGNTLSYNTNTMGNGGYGAIYNGQLKKGTASGAVSRWPQRGLYYRSGLLNCDTCDEQDFKNDFLVVYRYTDSQGNSARPLMRKVVTRDTTPPTVRLVGDETLENSAGSYVHSGPTNGAAQCVQKTNRTVACANPSPDPEKSAEENCNAYAGPNPEGGCIWSYADADNYGAGQDGLFDHNRIVTYFKHRDDCDKDIVTTVAMYSGLCNSNTRTKLTCNAANGGTDTSACNAGFFQYRSTGADTNPDAFEQPSADNSDNLMLSDDDRMQEFPEWTAGDYSITYEAMDSAGHKHSACRDIYNVDHTFPIIQILGSDQMTLEATHQGNYIDDGATCSDQVDGVISQNVEVSGDVVNLSKVGTYTITYNCKDSANNAAPAARRTVVVAQTSCPRCYVFGKYEINHEASFPYADAGAACSDVIDGTVSTECYTSRDGLGSDGTPDTVAADCKGSTLVDVETTGTYTIKYRAQNTVGLWNDGLNCRGGPKSYLRTIAVMDTLRPVISLKYKYSATGLDTLVARGTAGNNDGQSDGSGTGANSDLGLDNEDEGAYPGKTNDIVDTSSGAYPAGNLATLYPSWKHGPNAQFKDPETHLPALMAEESTSSVNGWVVGAIASAVAGLALLGYSTRRTAVATSVPV